jgi:hypothetical protein
MKCVCMHDGAWASSNSEIIHLYTVLQLKQLPYRVFREEIYSSLEQQFQNLPSMILHTARDLYDIRLL